MRRPTCHNNFSNAIRRSATHKLHPGQQLAFFIVLDPLASTRRVVVPLFFFSCPMRNGIRVTNRRWRNYSVVTFLMNVVTTGDRCGACLIPWSGMQHIRVISDFLLVWPERRQQNHPVSFFDRSRKARR